MSKMSSATFNLRAVRNSETGNLASNVIGVLEKLTDHWGYSQQL